MFQSFYDHKNDRFLVAPLRCGSSYTKLANALVKWSKTSHMLHRGDKIPNE